MVLGTYGTFIGDPWEFPCITVLVLWSSRTFLFSIVCAWTLLAQCTELGKRFWTCPALTGLALLGWELCKPVPLPILGRCFYQSSAVFPTQLLSELHLDLKLTAGHLVIVLPLCLLPPARVGISRVLGKGRKSKAMASHVLYL